MSRWHRTEFHFYPINAFRRRPDGRLATLEGGDSPDTSGQNAAALMQAQLSKEQLDWAKSIYNETAPQRAAAEARSAALSDAQLAQTTQQTAIAQQGWDDYQTTYRPLEQRMAAEAAAYDTPERRAAAAQAATADVQRNVDAARSATMREMERSGVNPASGKAMAMQGSMDLGAAKLKAGAGTTAMRQVETIGSAKMADAVNLGRGIASSQGTNAALAMQMGNSSVANSHAALGAATGGSGVVQQGYSGAQAGLGSAGGLYGNIAQQQGAAQASSNSNMMSGIGSIAAMAAMYMSDKDKKKDITPVDPDEALEAIEATPVSEWSYDAAKGGVADGGQRHIGPMAQDVRKTMGDRVAPGGKAIDPISANGVAMAAIHGLNRKVDKLAKQVKTIAA